MRPIACVLALGMALGSLSAPLPGQAQQADSAVARPAQQADSVVSAPQQADSAVARPAQQADPAVAPTGPSAPTQVPDSAAVAEAGDRSFLQAPAPPGGVGPGGAFWRSTLVPGWGHAAVGAYGRGAFYFAAASGVAYMLAKSVANRNSAQRARDARAVAVARRLAAEGTPADSIPGLIEEDEGVQEADDLVEVRGQQAQDWAALGIFILLLSGADAFVSAHLMEFPEPLTVDVMPGSRVEVGIRLPVGGPGG